MQRTHGEKSTNTPRNTHETPREWVAFTHEIGCEHSAGRRGPIHRARILILPKCVSISTNTCFHIIKYAFPFHRTRILVPHFVGVFVYAGTINRSPTAADGLPIIQRTHCETPYFDHVYTKKLLKPLGKKGFRRYFETKTAYRLRLFFIASIFS